MWLACRHHVNEIVLETNYKCIFGPSSSPDNPVFVDFRDNVWDTLDTKGPYKVLNINSRQLKSRKAEVLEFYTDILTIENSEGVLPRDDYRETAELMMILLDATPPRGVRIYRPHGLHRARWMAMIIYEGKRYTFSDQLNLDSVTVENLHRFCLFNALYYCPAWLSAPKGVDAAVNDLQFWKDKHHYAKIYEDLAQSALKAFDRHFWYMTEENVVLALFSEKVTNQEKTSLAKQLLKCDKMTSVTAAGQPTFPNLNMSTKLKI